MLTQDDSSNNIFSLITDDGLEELGASKVRRSAIDQTLALVVGRPEGFR